MKTFFGVLITKEGDIHYGCKSHAQIAAKFLGSSQAEDRCRGYEWSEADGLVLQESHQPFEASKAIVKAEETATRNLGREKFRRKVVLADPEWAYCYARDVDKEPRDDTRQAVLADPDWAYSYAKDIDKKPHKDTRQAVLANPISSYFYARYIDKKPRDDTRQAVLASPEWASYYAKDVDKKLCDGTW